jgi:hypothetical protein
MSDLPREELMAAADEALATATERSARVYFKFTCERCGARCMLSEPNVLYENGECCECGHVTKIERGGFTLEMTL